MISKDISLRGLEVFESIGQTGSIAKTAEAMKMSLPAISQQLRKLEEAVGRPLVDHARRPMQLTAAGRLFLHHTHDALRSLRQAQNEARVLDLSHLTQLRLGVIDDFDNSVTPELATTLASTLTNCEFRLHTRPSHELFQMARDGQLDVAVASSPEGGMANLVEYPLMTDPFVMIVPRGTVLDPSRPLASLAALPFLRYDREQMIGRQIETQLRRMRISLPSRFELGSNPTVNALVGYSRGWAITTALSYLRSSRFHDRIDVHALPFAAFSRTISLFASEDWIEGAAVELAGTFRTMLRSQVLPQAQARFPWLAERLAVIEP
jgi:DNA-binding transcriptional LysR family regulator